MKEEFKKFSGNIRLSEKQEEDASIKYSGVCKTLHNEYYETEYNGKTKFLFGSYKTKTNTRPISKDQDVDVLFKISQETFDKFDAYVGNGQSALLQEIRDCLKETYTTSETPKAWGKIVLVEFSNGKHNIEVLPALEKEDKTFLIPNSENGGSWDKFDPRSQVDIFVESNKESNGLTADLTRMFKTWIKTTPSLSFKSYDLLNYAIAFLNDNYKKGASYDEYPTVVKDFFEYLKDNVTGENESHIETGLNRACEAIGDIDDNKPMEASDEYRKIFGDEYPKVSSNPIKESKVRVFSSPSSPYAGN